MTRRRFVILFTAITIPIPVMRVTCSNKAVAQTASSYSHEEKPQYSTKTFVNDELGPACRIIDDTPKPADSKSKRVVCDGCHDIAIGGMGFIAGLAVAGFFKGKSS